MIILDDKILQAHTGKNLTLKQKYSLYFSEFCFLSCSIESFIVPKIFENITYEEE